jgi:hypothetical protein
MQVITKQQQCWRPYTALDGQFLFYGQYDFLFISNEYTYFTRNISIMSY